MNIVFPQNNFLLLSTIAFEIREVFMIPEHFKLKTHLLKFSKTISETRPEDKETENRTGNIS